MPDFIKIAIIIVAAVPAFGIVMGLIRKAIYHLIALISPGFAFALINYITFPGVVHHELSHALFGLLTGAKICHISLFKPQGMSLGSVEIGYRGPWILRCMQGCLSSCAPVFCGAITVYLLGSISLPVSIILHILICYLTFSITMHMTMSTPDLRCYLKGTPGFFIIALVLSYLITSAT